MSKSFLKQTAIGVALAATTALTSVTAMAADQAPAASEATKAAHAEILETYPFEDTQDFENARRGFIAPLPNNRTVTDADGNVVWNLERFSSKILQDMDAPETVNPALWRMAQLHMITGLFEVTPGIFQVRGYDLSNMTIVEGDEGITIYDPLISAETAKAALDLNYAERGHKPVKAIMLTHSQIDHFGGIRGVVDEADVKSGEVPIYAPEGFTEHAVAENVMAGTAMSRRASYMYGNLLPSGPEGNMTAGLGISTSAGTVTLIEPTHIIKDTGHKEVIDGIEYEFFMAHGSEAPAEMLWYMPQFKALNSAEVSTMTMHNLYTLRGAQARDAQVWPEVLNDVLRLYGDKAEVEFAMHHWPTWDKENIQTHIEAQRDTYKFIHDQTLHWANKGYTLNEIEDFVEIPEKLEEQWSSHGFYGSVSHNVRAVYNFYLGYFDGNPANLHPLNPTERSTRYVELLGGADAVMAEGQKAYDAGDYRWAAEVMKNLVFAQPDNQDAKNLQAEIFTQMGYQAESGPWRNFYLSGAQELRNGVAELPTPNTSSKDIISSMDLDLVFAYMGIQLNADRAAGNDATIAFDFTDVDEQHSVFLERSVLNHWPDYTADDADANVTLTRATMNAIMTGDTTFDDAIANGAITIEGDNDKFMGALSSLDNFDKGFWFNIVTP